jgi:glyoxylase-like metal-dependent hydrolase (beta-lactamase superfamily II)
MPLQSGQLDEIAPGVRRLVANNPGFMTGPGTNTYIVGRSRFLVIDPGPDESSHVQRILDLTHGSIASVAITHTHGDHSPAAVTLARLTGAALLGRAAPHDVRHDATFVPTRTLSDGDLVEVDGLTLRAVHTPGHASNHLCYMIDQHALLFSGDHLIQGSTVVIAPPDGHMNSYLRSLRRLEQEPIDRIAPGHGVVIESGRAEIARIIVHRLQRESKVVSALESSSESNLESLVRVVYDDVDPRIHALAQSSLLAHLIKLQEDGIAECRDERWRLRSI